MATEYEWKFKANAETLSAICQAFSEPGAEISMETTYYDTPTGALSARHYTLRRRLENGQSVCTLKTPAGSARNEWEIPCDSIEEAIEQLSRKLEAGKQLEKQQREHMEEARLNFSAAEQNIQFIKENIRRITDEIANYKEELIKLQKYRFLFR